MADDTYAVAQYSNQPGAQAPIECYPVSGGRGRWTFDEATDFVRVTAPMLTITHLIVRKCPRS